MLRRAEEYMEENKKCCEGKECGNCPMMHGGFHGCGHMGKCHMMKKLICFILMIVVFCLGVQLGELKSQARGNYFYRGGMMNWGYKNVKPLTNDTTPVTPATTPPTATQ